MKSKKQDFFSDPEWPATRPLPNSRPEPHVKESTHEGTLQKEGELNPCATLFQTRDQYTIDPPSLFQSIKKEQPEQCSPLLFFSPLKEYSESSQVKNEEFPSQSLLALADASQSHSKEEYGEQKIFEEEFEEGKQSLFSFPQKARGHKKAPIDGKWRKWRSPYQILDTKVKKYLVEQTKYNSVAKVSKMFGVSINNLCRWKKSCERKVGAGRKVTNNALEDKLIGWISGQMKKNSGRSLTRKLIQQKAREWSDNPQFKASKGWLERFVQRNKFLKLHIKLKMSLKELQSQESSDDSNFMNLELGECLARRHSLRLKSKISSEVSDKNVDDLELLSEDLSSE